MEPKNYPGINRMYSDNSGEDFRVLHIATNTMINEKDVIYQSVHTGAFYSTPLVEFNKKFKLTYSNEQFENPQRVRSINQN